MTAERLPKQTRRGVVTAVLLGAVYRERFALPAAGDGGIQQGQRGADGACRAGPDAVLLKLSCERRESAAYRAVCGGGAQPGRGCFISFAQRDLSCAVCGGASAKYYSG